MEERIDILSVNGRVEELSISRPRGNEERYVLVTDSEFRDFRREEKSKETREKKRWSLNDAGKKIAEWLT